MGLRAVLASLPEDYVLLRGRRGLLAVDRARQTQLAHAGFHPDGGERLPASDLAGRAPLRSIELSGERWVVRDFHHGGALRWLGQRAFLDPARPFRELCMAWLLDQAGIRTPRVVAARALRDPLGWRLSLISVRVEDGVDVGSCLARMQRGELQGAARARCLRALGAFVGQLHARGFLHADLTPRNLLVSGVAGPVWVLDLDRARLVGPLSDGERRDNLRRLYRAVRRREAHAGPFLRAADFLRFLGAYRSALGPGEGWRADWRAIVQRDRGRALWHRAGWLLEDVLGEGAGQRDARAARRPPR
jgi:hypothetical protein